MSNLWPRVEPLLARVEKPARYIGMERGSLRPEHRPLIARLFPNAEHVVIADAGHWPHVDRPAEFLAHVRGLLA